jgi:hypothetical protein
MSAPPSLPALAKSYESTSKAAPRSIADIPSSTPQAEALARQLKAQGYRFVGPTSVYAFMQNVGMVNDHVRGCFLASPAGTRREVRSLSVRTGAGHPITGSDSGGCRSSWRRTRSASTATTFASL